MEGGGSLEAVFGGSDRRRGFRGKAVDPAPARRSGLVSRAGGQPGLAFFAGRKAGPCGIPGPGFQRSPGACGLSRPICPQPGSRRVPDARHHQHGRSAEPRWKGLRGFVPRVFALRFPEPLGAGPEAGRCGGQVASGCLRGELPAGPRPFGDPRLRQSFRVQFQARGQISRGSRRPPAPCTRRKGRARFLGGDKNPRPASRTGESQQRADSLPPHFSGPVLGPARVPRTGDQPLSIRPGGRAFPRGLPRRPRRPCHH